MSKWKSLVMKFRYGVGNSRRIASISDSIRKDSTYRLRIHTVRRHITSGKITDKRMMDVLDVHHSFYRVDFCDVTILRIVDVDMTIPVDEVDACRVRQEHPFDFRIR